MSWEQIKDARDGDFKRYTGVRRKVFEVMMEVL